MFLFYFNQSVSGYRFYYLSKATNERADQLPSYLNPVLRQFGDWAEYLDLGSQHVFYYNSKTGERSWDPPAIEDLMQQADEPATGQGTSGADGTGGGGPGAGGSVAAGGGSNGGGASVSSARGSIRRLSSTRTTASASAFNIDAGLSASLTGVEVSGDSLFRKKRFQLLWSRRLGNVDATGLSIQIRRAKVLEDSFRALGSMQPADLQRKLKVVFAGEEGQDTGGLTKEWCLLFSQQLRSNDLPFFERTAEGLLQIHPFAGRTKLRVKRMRLIGRFLAKSIFERQMVELPLSHCLCMHLLGQRPALDDLQWDDRALYNGLKWSLDNDITDVLDNTFTVDSPPTAFSKLGWAPTDDIDSSDLDEPLADVSTRQAKPVRPGGTAVSIRQQTVELRPGGAGAAVTESNKAEYVRLMVQYKTGGQAGTGLLAFVAGFHELFPKESLSSFTVDELRQLLEGRRGIDWQSVQQSTRYTDGLNGDSEVSGRREAPFTSQLSLRHGYLQDRSASGRDTGFGVPEYR